MVSGSSPPRGFVGLTELLEHGADVADIGPTEEEKRELLAG